MAIHRFLAMTGAEIFKAAHLPPSVAWMACHFSPCSQGLSNLPLHLPEGALLVLDDAWPYDGHDGQRIAGELSARVEALRCCGVLLDFQRPKTEEAQSLAEGLCEALPCPVAVTAAYAGGCNCAVFLPPLPCHTSLADWLAPWCGREIWLELALDGETIILTDKGMEIAPGDFVGKGGFEDKKLHCHYSVAVEEDRAIFRLWRTEADLERLIAEAESLGVQAAVGLYQELSGSCTNGSD